MSGTEALQLAGVADDRDAPRCGFGGREEADDHAHDAVGRAGQDDVRLVDPAPDHVDPAAG